MTADTTSSNREGMTCDLIAAEATIERYLRDELNEEDREAFERHYFECQRCFDELQTLEAVTRELRQRPAVHVAARKPLRTWPIAAAGIAAALLVAATAMIWKQSSPLPASSRVATRSSPSDAAAPTQTLPGREGAERSESRPLSLEQLARAEPAPYEPGTFRSVPDAATARFQQGMERYRQGDYRSAIPDLEQAAGLDPAAAHIQFFLGVSQLITGDADSAIDSLRAAVAVGDSPYLEESHLYLAKALLQRQDVAAAQRQLQEVVALQGPRRAEANQLLDHIARLKSQ